jgi:ubiquinone/menaquinone biosynthesis C-methylase UbiE
MLSLAPVMVGAKGTSWQGLGGEMSGYWERQGLAEAIGQAVHALGKPTESLTVDDVAQLDQFHGGGKRATERLANAAGLSAGMRVIDVGGGLGGPARTLAAQYGCTVTVIDLTESYVEAARMLTELLGLADRVSHQVGNALELPFSDASFDVVWTQNSGMNIADKERLYAGFRRVVRTEGILAFQEPMAGPVQPPIYPLMWAEDASGSFLRSPDEMSSVIEAAGFERRHWVDATDRKPATGAAPTSPTIQGLIMGERLAAITAAQPRNTEENRVVIYHGVFRARG